MVHETSAAGSAQARETAGLEREAIRAARAVLSLARHTLVDAFRERAFRGLSLFLLVLLGVARLIGPLALGEGRRITLDVGLTLITLFGLFLILTLGTRSVQKEVEQKTILMLLARPVRRGEFVLGKFFGSVAVVATGLSGMLAILAGVLLLSGYEFNGSLAVAGYYAFLELVIVSALSMLLTVFTSPVLAAFFLLGLFVAGHLAPSLLEMARLLPGGAAARALESLLLVVPRLDLYRYGAEVVHGIRAPASQVAWATLYAGLYSAAALLLGILAFRRREFS